MMRTIFKEITNESYFEFSNYPKIVLKVNSELLKAGIKEVRVGGSLNDDSSYVKDITLIIRPSISSSIGCSSGGT